MENFTGKVGDEIRYMKQRKVGKSICMEVFKGKVLAFRVVRQAKVLRKDGNKVEWVDVAGEGGEMKGDQPKIRFNDALNEMMDLDEFCCSHEVCLWKGTLPDGREAALFMRLTVEEDDVQEALVRVYKTQEGGDK